MVNNPLFEVIKHEIKLNNVVVFLCGIAEFPLCPSSAYVVETFAKLQVPVKIIDVAVDHSMRDAVEVFANWPRLPIIYVKQELLGDADVLRNMEKNGELYKFLTGHGIAYKIEDLLL